MDRRDERLQTYYLQDIVPHSDVCYRLAYAITLNHRVAEAWVLKIFRQTVGELDVLAKIRPNPHMHFFGQVAKSLRQTPDSPPETGAGVVLPDLRRLSTDERLALSGTDLAGLRPNEVSKLMGLDPEKFRTILGLARRKVIDAPNVDADDEFFYSYMSEYLDDDLEVQDRNRFLTVLRAGDRQKYLERYSDFRGQFQVAFQKLNLPPQIQAGLRGLLVDPILARQIEDSEIASVDRANRVGTWVRLLVGIAAVAGLGMWAFRTMRSDVPAVDVLQYVGYEALAIAADPQNRIDMPSSNPGDIQKFFASYPGGLGFEPKPLPAPGGWRIFGATVIEYDDVKLAATRYVTETGEDFVYFSYAGNLKHLPVAEKGNHNGLVYQTYATNAFNVVAWQVDDEVLAIIVGRQSAIDLAGFALGSKMQL